ncbi:hypothetical protein LINPERHAP2_LOCUS41766, partial [Linum perenne]
KNRRFFSNSPPHWQFSTFLDHTEPTSSSPLNGTRPAPVSMRAFRKASRCLQPSLLKPSLPHKPNRRRHRAMIVQIEYGTKEKRDAGILITHICVSV